MTNKRPRTQGRPATTASAATPEAKSAPEPQLTEAPATEPAAEKSASTSGGIVSKRTARERRLRKNRGSMDGARDLKLAVSVEKDPSYVYRWVNDEKNGRIARMTNSDHDDWEVVQEEDARYVGRDRDNTPLQARLLRKPREFYEEDRRAKQAADDRLMSGIKVGKVDGSDIQTEDGQSASYVPEGGITVDRKVG